MVGGLGVSAIGLVLAGSLAVAAVPQSAESQAEAAGDALGEVIESRLRADGPFFTPEERAVIERACGYAPGEWDGYQINITNHVLTCTNGRRVATPEVRAVLAAAEPRIEARVQRVMASAEVSTAIARVAETATAQAMREVETALAGLDEEIDLSIDLDVDADAGADAGDEGDAD